jgi:hypothetical protein
LDAVVEGERVVSLTQREMEGTILASGKSAALKGKPRYGLGKRGKNKFSSFFALDG